jgi:hypothetical protein
MPNVRVHNFAISLDGYGAGPDQDVDHPLGVGGNRLHTWAFKTRSGRQMLGQSGGEDLDGGTQGYECVELVSSPSVTHARLARTTR